jgi:hypothetical protein
MTYRRSTKLTRLLESSGALARWRASGEKKDPAALGAPRASRMRRLSANMFRAVSPAAAIERTLKSLRRRWSRTFSTRGCRNQKPAVAFGDHGRQFGAVALVRAKTRPREPHGRDDWRCRAIPRSRSSSFLGPTPSICASAGSSFGTSISAISPGSCLISALSLTASRSRRRVARSSRAIASSMSFSVLISPSSPTLETVCADQELGRRLYLDAIKTKSRYGAAA